ncbi:UMP-CMP kinase 2, mitochondrial-like isoform X1 [Macrosteles quadrilineatus]|uniref:UMP-CMP kinase 2, mitochondrial-like isoform X1 n=2 Tax=Macrosteles quadrilineatus TaxID=74068 RepID=UPI0023E2FD66|nr:UMP-CMP kinase 2, mitochondrial-like isoform X1 [Macrosteles quadrilineatus]
MAEMGEETEGPPENSTLSSMGGYGVWHSAQDILSIFNGEEYQKLPGIRAVVSTYQELLSQPSYDPHDDPPVELRHPFIAVEGTHRDSRIILGKELANYLRATYLGNPPRSMLPLRRLFDREKGMLRKAYFSLCMYVGAHHVRETWVREPVVTTGYWLDQAAFSIAQRFSLMNLPPEGHPVYEYPEDLVKPDVAFFLNIPSLRGSNKPPNPFKPKLVEVYRRLRGVKIVEINSTGTYRKIFEIIKTHLKFMFNIKDPVTEKTQLEFWDGDQYGHDNGFDM